MDVPYLAAVHNRLRSRHGPSLVLSFFFVCLCYDVGLFLGVANVEQRSCLLAYTRQAARTQHHPHCVCPPSLDNTWQYIPRAVHALLLGTEGDSHIRTLYAVGDEVTAFTCTSRGAARSKGEHTPGPVWATHALASDLIICACPAPSPGPSSLAQSPHQTPSRPAPLQRPTVHAYDNKTSSRRRAEPRSREEHARTEGSREGTARVPSAVVPSWWVFFLATHYLLQILPVASTTHNSR
jgi:hypothetical protein